MIKLKSFSGNEEKYNKALEIKAALDKLPSKINEIQFYESGINMKESERSADIALISKFKTLADLESYIVNPNHQAVVEIIQKYSSNITAVDYEQ